MPANTPNYAWPYQLLTDPPNGASLGHDGLIAADASLAAEQTARTNGDSTLTTALAASGFGRLGSGVYTGGGGTVTTELLLTGTSFTITCVAGRRYRAIISGSMRITSSASPGWYVARYVAGAGPVSPAGTAIGFLEYGGAVTAFVDDRSRIVEFTSPGAGTFTFGLLAASPITGSVTINAGTAAQAQSLILDDVGT